MALRPTRAHTLGRSVLEEDTVALDGIIVFAEISGHVHWSLALLLHFGFCSLLVQLGNLEEKHDRTLPYYI